jgi:hypothetical protein
VPWRTARLILLLPIIVFGLLLIFRHPWSH